MLHLKSRQRQNLNPLKNQKYNFRKKRRKKMIKLKRKRLIKSLRKSLSPKRNFKGKKSKERRRCP